MPNVTKLFTVLIKFFQYARMFVPGRPFQFSLMFVDKARSLINSGVFQVLHSSRLSTFLANIRLGWKGFTGTNNLTY